MSFRQKKNKNERADRVKWEAFCRANWDLIDRIGLTMPTIETLDRFHDLLVECYIEHYDDPTEFRLWKLDSEKFDLMRELVDRYFAAGFENPFMSPAAVGGREAYLSLVRKYPDKFHDFDVGAANEWYAEGGEEQSREQPE